MPTINLIDTERELDRLASCASLTTEARLATKYASELLRAFRAAFDLDWKTNAADLHGHAHNCAAHATGELDKLAKLEAEHADQWARLWDCLDDAGVSRAEAAGLSHD